MNNKIICVDANLLVRLVSSPISETVYLDLWEQWKKQNYQVFAPSLCYYEVANALHRMYKANLLTLEETNIALEDALNLDITLYSNINLHRQALKLARQIGFPAAYDAHYLALAQLLESDFYTADKKLFNSVKDLFDWIHLVQ
jgi:predicted nucleic acid-binding protein